MMNFKFLFGLGFLAVLYCKTPAFAQGVILVDNFESIEKWKISPGLKVSLDNRYQQDGWNSMNVRFRVNKPSHGMMLLTRTDLQLPVPREIALGLKATLRLPTDQSILLRVLLQDSEGSIIQKLISFKESHEWNPWEKEVLKLSEFQPLFPPGKETHLKDIQSISLAIVHRAGEYRDDLEYGFNVDVLACIYDDFLPWSIKKTEELKGAFEPLYEKVQKINSQSVSVYKMKATGAVVEQFLPYIVEEAKGGNAMHAYRNIQFCTDRIDELKKSVAMPMNDASVFTRPSMKNVVLKEDGNFFDGDTPLLLTGLVGWWEPSRNNGKPPRDYFGTVAKTGFNAISWEAGYASFWPEKGKDESYKINEIVEITKEAGLNGLAMDFLISSCYIPEDYFKESPDIDPLGWRRARHPFINWSMESESLKKMFGKVIDLVVPKFTELSNVVAYDIINELWYDSMGDYDREDFELFLAQKYGKIEGLNLVWGSHYSSFQNIEKMPVNDPAMEDIGEFTAWRVRNFMGFAAERIKKLDSRRPVYAKMLGGYTSVIGEDYEMYNEVLGAHGTDHYPLFGNGEWAAFFWVQALKTDIYRSLAPQKPQLDSEYHIIPYNQIVPPEYIQAALFNRAIHGTDLINLWVWHREIENPIESLYTQPWAVESAGHAAIDLQRLAPWILPFHNYRSPVALLYDGPTAMEAYRLTTYAGMPVDVFTAKSILKNLEGRKLVIIPAHADTKVIEKIKEKMGQNLIFLETGTIDQLVNLNTACERRGVQPLVRLVAQDSMFGVETRSIPWKGKWITYVCNLRHEKVEIKVMMAGKEVPSTDLITGKKMNPSLSLKPLATMLLLTE
jgi:hypothetical protein